MQVTALRSVPTHEGAPYKLVLGRGTFEQSKHSRRFPPALAVVVVETSAAAALWSLEPGPGRGFGARRLSGLV